MLYHKCQCAPLVQDFKGFLHAFRGKEELARAEVEQFFTGRGVLVVCVLLCVWVALFAFVCFFFPVKILHSIWVSFHFEFRVVDRLCHVLARQCRKKNF